MKKISYGENKNIIGERLRALRKSKGKTQNELAAAMQVLGVSVDQQMISRVENNERIVTDYELACFAQALGVELSDLIDITLIDK